jgi:uncharacterized membrane protein YfcA
MEMVLLAAWCFIVAVLGGPAGLVLGNIRLPAVLLLASSPAAGAGANVGISAVSAATASVTHIRAGRVNWRLFWWMTPPTVVGALIGGYLSGVMPGDILRLIIAGVLYYSAVDLLLWRRRRKPVESSGELDLAAAVGSGLLIGVLGGVVGLILGTLRIPALLRFVGESPAMAVGTNATVGVCLGIGGVIGHLPSASPDWDLLAVGAAASIPGAIIGARLVGRLSEERLIDAIGAILLVAATGLLIQALV